MKGISIMIGNIVRDVIIECGSIHNFDASETILNLKLEEKRMVLNIVAHI